MSAPPIGLATRLLAVAGIELTSWLLTQMILAQYHWSSPVAELLRTMIRLQTVTFDWYLFRDFVRARPRPLGATGSRTVALPMFLMLCGALLMPHPRLSGPVSLLFAATSLAVGLKEEVLFRGIVQSLLRRRFDGVAAVVATSVLFTVWHAGAVSLTLSSAAEIFLASTVLGLLYLRTGSLRAVIVLHAAYDALYVLAPSLGGDERHAWALLPLAAAAIALLRAAGHLPHQRIVTGSRQAVTGALAEPAARSSESTGGDGAVATGGGGATLRAWSGPVRTMEPIA